MKNKKLLIECILVVVLGAVCFSMWHKYMPEFPILKDAPSCKDIQESEEDNMLLRAADAGCLVALRTLAQEETTEPVTNKLTKFYAASITGDAKTVRKMLNKGVKPDVLGSDPFGYACRRGHLDVVKEFIKAGADVNAQGGWPLVAAADKGHLAVVQELIKAGADVNGQYGQYKRTPLEFAAYGGHLAVVQELIKNGADVKASGALASAADKGHLDVVKELIKNGADVNGKEGEPLQNAVSGGYLDVVQELIKDGADVNLPTKVGNLQAAAETGNVDIVKALIKAGAKVNAGTKTKPFYTAWAVATGLDNKDIVAELERAGARGSRDQRSYALGYAALKGNLELVKKLLKAGADVNGVGNDSPLGWAIDEEGHLDVVQELIKAGADVNKRFGDPKNNLTPLHIAALFGNMEIAKALVDAGADTLVRTKEGRTPRMTAAQSGHAELAAMFREAEKKQKEAK